MSQLVPVIAIDGPSGVGKTTVSARVAAKLGYHLLLSGTFYRALAYCAPNDSVSDLDKMADNLDLSFNAHTNPPSVVMNGKDMTAVLMNEDCAARAAQLAEQPKIRRLLSARMLQLRRAPGLVAEGRDMATVVFSDATLKIYLDAPHEVRARRREKQLKQCGISDKLEDVGAHLLRRDKRDYSRKIDPLIVADDALVIDTSVMLVESVVTKVIDLINGRVRETQGLEMPNK